MFGDLFEFVCRVFSHWIAWVGLLSTAMRIRAEISENPAHTFLGNRRLWTSLAVLFLFAACFQAWRDEHAMVAVEASPLESWRLSKDRKASITSQVSSFGGLKAHITFRTHSGAANLLADDLREAFERAKWTVEERPGWMNQVGVLVRVDPASLASLAVFNALHDVGLVPSKLEVQGAPTDEVQITVGDRP